LWSWVVAVIRSVREISLDMKHSLAKLVDATIRIEEAGRETGRHKV
jgi:hypothetical protein